MATQIINRARWLAQHGLQTIGWPGTVALGLIVCNVAFYFSALVPAQENIAALQQQTASLQERTLHSPKPQESDAGPEGQLSTFYKDFQNGEHIPDQLEKIYRAAESSGIKLTQGGYRLIPDQDGKLMRYQITLPLTGSYVNIRKFLAQVMSDVPVLSLDSVSFQRQKISESVLESQVKLTLYMGAK
jgi:Tfp pilus assembly protein PilO